MKLIAHRGNINGPLPLEENRPEYVENAIGKGFDVEIDLWYDSYTNSMYLGHDDPQYVVDILWLCKYRENLWIHCKNIEALYKFSSETNGYNYFWHQDDDYTLTSMRYIWTYPGKSYTSKSVIVMPEKFLKDDLNSLMVYNCYGVCTDYPSKLV
jgi:hypothetical protein